MKESNRRLVGAALLAVAGMMLLGARPQGEPDGLFAGLEVGQAVGVKDLGTAYEVTVFEGGQPAGYEVTEIGADHLGIRDHAGVVERRIPITSIKSVAWMRLGRTLDRPVARSGRGCD
ncbi:hypothetical protein [Tautonia plasticadhaerens]|uniref:Uncharacterized protein n=1 Tax=Tautonia plasticadhaerens TaxID=2527974 RepID=A0A518H401_9BACT|nr:hypothetical protein [Tautonia plasticadhaerens]QDV35581.1 hypothetical protein ElP_34850 [Tautonia plasticadhaerens]